MTKPGVKGTWGNKGRRQAEDALIGDVAMERSSVGDGSPLLRTKKKQAACQEWLRPVSLKLFIHHTEMRQHLLLQPWCFGAEAIRKSGWA